MKQYFFIFVCLFFISGCSTSYLSKIDREEWIEGMAESALVTGNMSYLTRHYLVTNALLAKFENEPKKVVWELAKHLEHPEKSKLVIFNTERETLEVLIELCMLMAEDNSDHDALPYWISCCYYSYRYVFDNSISPSLSYSDPLQLAAAYRYYNISLSEFFAYLIKNEGKLEKEMILPLVMGSVKFTKPHSDLLWNPDQFKEFMIGFDYVPKNMISHSFSAGLGVPIVGLYDPDLIPDPKDEHAFLKRVYPFTYFLRFNLSTTLNSRVVAAPEFLDGFNDEYVIIDKKPIPLAKDFSVMIGAFMEGKSYINGIKYMFAADKMGDLQGLYFITPYNPKKIPVVLVHGLMSDPRTWAQTLNSLLGNRTIRENFQFWLYAYPTGQPIIYSAKQFRKALLQVQAEYDPKADNPNFNNMVIVGHSMGGLVTRLSIQSSEGQKLIKKVLKSKLDKIDFNEEQKQFITDILVFDSLPFVKRALFLSTPHKGSEIAAWSISRFGSSMISLPSKLRKKGHNIIKKAAIAAKLKDADYPVEIATGIDNLDPDNTMIKITYDLPIRDDIIRHSIIGDDEKAHHKNGTDGIVPYWSSHREKAVSELVVKSGHTVQDKPDCVKEITRILLKHLKEKPASK